MLENKDIGIRKCLDLMIDSSAEQQSKLITSAKSYGSSSYDKLEKVKVAAGVLAFWRLL